MEAVLAQSDQHLLGEISLTAPQTSEYIVARDQFETYSSVPVGRFAGVSTIGFSVGSSINWLMGDTCYISFLVRNNSTDKKLYFGSPIPHILFQSFELRLGGICVEQITQYARLAESMSNLQSAEKLRNQCLTGFGILDQPVTSSATAGDPIIPNLWRTSSYTMPPIDEKGVPGFETGTNSRRVTLDFPLSGVLGAAVKFLPLFSLPSVGLELLLSLARPEDCVVLGVGGNTFSADYQLEDLKFHGSMCTLDSALSERYFAALRDGRTLLYPTRAWTHNEVFLSPSSDGSFEVSLNRPLSRLASVFATFCEDLTDVQKHNGFLYANTFRFYQTHQCIENFEYILTVGAQRIPQAYQVGAKAAFMNLSQTLGVHNSLSNSLSFSFYDYTSTKFIIGIDCEKCPLAASSGISTQGSQILRLDIRRLGDGAGAFPKRCWITTQADSFIEFRSGSVVVLT